MIRLRIDEPLRRGGEGTGTMQQISYRAGVTLAGGAPFSRATLDAALGLAPHPVAADGGADGLLGYGVVPEAVIGDMDSRHAALPPGVAEIAVAEQETTDFEKCLARLDAPLIVGVGFLGGRLDHTLAALSTLLGHAGRPVILLGEEDVSFVAPEGWSMAVAPGTRVSFYPLRPATGVASRGLRWPIDGLAMAAGGRIGTSNEAADARIAARFDRPGIVTMLPARCLSAAVESLVAM